MVWFVLSTDVVLQALASHGDLREELALQREDTGARKHQGHL